MTESVAHTAPDGRLHFLVDHLEAVASGAAHCAGQFDAAEWARFGGLWHDFGKYRAGFQSYVRQSHDPDSHIEGRIGGREKTHSAAGAIWSARYFKENGVATGPIISRVLSYIIAGHHAGLDNWDDGLSVRLQSKDSALEFEEALSAALDSSVIKPEFPTPDVKKIPHDRKTGVPGSFALWVRMLFSTLVDADFLDTEAFIDIGKAARRDGFASPARLLELFDAHMSRMQAGAPDTPVNALRSSVLAQCRSRAALPQGVFTLSVPTGGGKTLPSLAFALTHAVRHQRRRVVYAIPYTSIIEQTADIFRAIVGDENVVEHHSNAEAEPERETHRSRLACENWDAPLVVTTNVQLFESLFARKTSRCRKLHNLVGSVLILDEAQLLPVDFLQPILDVLRLLVRDYGVTIVLCTATQPALTSEESFDAHRALRGFNVGEVTEIVDDVAHLYQKLKRVDVYRPVVPYVKQAWPEIAKQVMEHEVVLAIVNRRADARELYDLVRAHDPRGLWHLSALMCPQHRSAVIAAIKRDLIAYRDAKSAGGPVVPVRVISTQLVEAGVDIDFPVVFRAMAGLDAIAQAAGRCNREGRLERGQVHVFVPPTLPPPGFLRQAENTCRTVWDAAPGDPLDFRLFQGYFRRLYGDGNLDKHGVCEMLRAGGELEVRFKDAAEAFRLIDDEAAATVVVRYPVGESSQVDQWLAMLERDGPARWLMRKLQRYCVSIYRHDIQRLLVQGDIRELNGCPGLYVQMSDLLYDAMTGVNLTSAPGDPTTLVH